MESIPYDKRSEKSGLTAKLLTGQMLIFTF